jgi:predicted GIY-YIG superfamily endonuclease
MCSRNAEKDDLFKMASKRTYRVYVVELARRVYTDNAKFRTANPQYNGVLECLYVGMTSKTPQERLEQHKSGYRTKTGRKVYSNIVRKYGLYLRPSLCEHVGPISTRKEALEMEKQLALELRRRRYAVWSN